VLSTRTPTEAASFLIVADRLDRRGRHAARMASADASFAAWP